MTDAEVAAAMEEVRMRGKRGTAHARSAASVKQALRHGIDVIYHASFTDEETLDMLEAARDRVFVAPGIAILYAMLHEAEPWGITHDKAVQMGYQVEWDAAIESLKAMHKRGVRILFGGDYGFAFTPHGQNARDLEFFVKYLGFTPGEAIRCATMYGGQIMMKPGELGQIKEGYPGRPAAGRWRPDGQPRDPARSETHPRGDEGRRVRQAARHRCRTGVGACGMTLSPRRWTRGQWAAWLLLGVPIAGFAIWAIADNDRLFFTTVLNALTLASLYFLVASGFTLVFGLMRNVNLAHGSLYLLGAYIGWVVGEQTGSWVLAVATGFITAAVVGLLLQVLVFRWMQGQDLRQTLVTIGISIVLADVMLWVWGGEIYTFEPPAWIYGSTVLPLVEKFPTYRIAVFVMAVAIGLVLWWFLARTRVGMMIRAGVDDRGMLAASGVNVQLLFATTFAIGAGLAGLAGVVGGSALSVSPGEDTRYLLASLVVVIVGGMGSVGGAAIGAILIGAAEQFGLAYAPTYGIVFTFVIMVLVLAFRPHGIMGRMAA